MGGSSKRAGAAEGATTVPEKLLKLSVHWMNGEKPSTGMHRSQQTRAGTSDSADGLSENSKNWSGFMYITTE